mgnify:CR=1 FL=1
MLAVEGKAAIGSAEVAAEFVPEFRPSQARGLKKLVFKMRCLSKLSLNLLENGHVVVAIVAGHWPSKNDAQRGFGVFIAVWWWCSGGH